MLASTAGLGLAAACGASDDKKVANAEAGAAGAGPSDGGGPAAGGAPGEGGAAGGTPGEGGGAAGQATSGGAPPDTTAGGEGGVGGAPTIDACVAEGSVTALSLNTEPIYQGCRGAVLRVPFDASDAAAKLTCCGTSTSDPSFSLALAGTFDAEVGGVLEFQVPDDAPLGTYALELICQTQPNDQAFSIEIGASSAPVVLSVNAELTPISTMVINGQHLAAVDRVGATRLSDGAYYECIVEADGQSDNSIRCSFNGVIPESEDANDFYVIDVENSDCGHAANPPQFLVSPLPT